MKLIFFSDLVLQNAIKTLFLMIILTDICLCNFYMYYYGTIISDLPQVGGFLRVLRFPPSIKLTNTI